MKHIYYIIVFSFSFQVSAQVIKGVVRDSITNDLISFTNITLKNKDKGAYSNSEGAYSLEINNFFNDTLLISNIGYKSKLLPLNKFAGKNEILHNIFLVQEREEIDEVVLDVKKSKYSSSKKIGTKRKGKYPSSKPFGNEICILIKNPNYERGKLSKINVFFKKRKKSIYETYPANYKIKFYNYNSSKDMPSKLLSYDNIIIKPDNNTEKVSINLSEYNILFPQDGLCIGIETIDPNPLIKKKSMYITSPNILMTHDLESLSWSRYRGKEWHKIRRKSVFKKKMYQNPLVNIEVRFKK